MSKSRKVLVFKNRCQVYLKPEYHPALQGSNLSHFDIARKAREVFGRGHGNVKALPKICSKNGEDAQALMHFSPLLSM